MLNLKLKVKRRTIGWAGLLLTSLVFYSCNGVVTKSIQGSGIIVQDIRVLSAFHSIVMGISADLVFSVGSDQYFEIVGDDNIIQEIETFVQPDGSLEIFCRKTIRPSSKLKIYVSMTEAKGFYLSGEGTIQGQNPFSPGELILQISGSGLFEAQVAAGHVTSTISGSGTVQLSGSAEMHEITISGSGSVNVLGLNTARCVASISGSGSCRVFVRQFLGVDISGSGNVFYRGAPEITTQISGSGQLINLN